MSYETLDTIADSYIPLLLLLYLGQVIALGLKQQLWLKPIASLMLMVMAVYGLMYLDYRFALWLQVGLDYSTHTAAALALCWLCFVAALALLRKSLQDWPQTNSDWLSLSPILLPVSLILYGFLMDYQDYHPWSDMITTAGAIVPFLVIQYRWLASLPKTTAKH